MRQVNAFQWTRFELPDSMFIVQTPWSMDRVYLCIIAWFAVPKFLEHHINASIQNMVIEGHSIASRLIIRALSKGETP